MSVLHVANGDDNLSRIRVMAADDVLVWREALADGPVVTGQTEKLFAVRRDFVERAYSSSPDQYGLMVEVEFERMRATQSNTVILHFDEDLFCVVNALFCIAHLQHVQRLSWMLRSSTVELTMMDRIFAESCWRAYAGDDPEILADLIRQCPPQLQFVARALRAHLARFPSIITGFGGPQEIILELIDRGIEDDASIVSAFIALDDNRYGWGDTQILREKHLVEAILKGADPLVELGGVRFRRSSPHWLWNPSRGTLVWSNDR